MQLIENQERKDTFGGDPLLRLRNRWRAFQRWFIKWNLLLEIGARLHLQLEI